MSDPNQNQNETTNKLLTQKAIREGIWQAIKTKTNYNLLDSNSKSKTGGIFSEAIWLKDNYSATDNKQDVVGKLLTSLDNNSYISAETYNQMLSNSPNPITVPLNEKIGLANNTSLYKLPIADAKLLLPRLIYDEAKLYSEVNKHILKEVEQDFEEQRLLLTAYDIVDMSSESDDLLPSSFTLTSNIYKDDNDSSLRYSFTLANNKYSFTILNQSYIYYPEKILIRFVFQNKQRYLYDNNNQLIKIDNIALTTPIPVDFEYENYKDYFIAELNN